MYDKVMVIDDNQIDLYIAEISIKKSGFAHHIICKKSATSALDYLTVSANNPTDLPQIIFLDINMPEINGFQFLEAFEQLPQLVKATCTVIVVSSSMDPEDDRKVRESPFAFKFINKPLVKEKLHEIVKEMQF